MPVEAIAMTSNPADENTKLIKDLLKTASQLSQPLAWRISDGEKLTYSFAIMDPALHDMVFPKIQKRIISGPIDQAKINSAFKMNPEQRELVDASRLSAELKEAGITLEQLVEHKLVYGKKDGRPVVADANSIFSEAESTAADIANGGITPEHFYLQTPVADAIHSFAKAAPEDRKKVLQDLHSDIHAAQQKASEEFDSELKFLGKGGDRDAYRARYDAATNHVTRQEAFEALRHSPYYHGENGLSFKERLMLEKNAGSAMSRGGPMTPARETKSATDSNAA